ncbi:MAG: T9SS type A sorting domain-containing protein, partial [Flavobacteriaceae bacterium]
RATIDLTIPFGASITDYENAGWTGFKSITYPLGVITVDDTDAAQHRATFTFDAPVSGFTVDAITLANATVVPDSFTGGDGDTVYTVDIAPDTTALTVANPYMTVSVDGSGQPLDYVYIPDTNFRDALINNPDIDTDGDDLIGPTEANAFTGSIGVRNLSITDLTGIGAFVNITDLNCSDNDLTGLNVSNNTELLYLQCFTTGLTSLDVIANTALRALNCRNNSLTSLDVSNNPDLTYLNCESNSLTSLNVASGNNTAIDYFFGTNNPNLSCIQVDDANYSSANWTAIDPSSSFSADCGYISTSSVSSKMAIGNTQVVANTVGTINDISFMDQTFAETISIYPNPVENTFNIGAPSGFQLKQAKIYSVLGEAVLSATTNQIDASYLPSGMYILKVEGANGKIMTKRIVKK